MDERLRFIARLLDGEKMAPLCAEFGISRKTGYKVYHRYKGYGLDGLTDRSRAPIAGSPRWITRCTTGQPPSPAAGGFAGSAERST